MGFGKKSNSCFLKIHSSTSNITLFVCSVLRCIAQTLHWKHVGSLHYIKFQYKHWNQAFLIKKEGMFSAVEEKGRKDKDENWRCFPNGGMFSCSETWNDADHDLVWPHGIFLNLIPLLSVCVGRVWVHACWLGLAPLLMGLTSFGQRSDSDEWKRMKQDC